MSSPQHPGIGERPTATCGNCGASVSAADIICPACGVLLAAYQAPAGATASDGGTSSALAPVGDTSATRDVPVPHLVSPSAPPAPVPEPVPAPTPARHRPRSQSPIGDALQRSRESGMRSADGLASDAIADELAGMAADDSDLAREVEAELTGARVTFDGAQSTIETDRVDITHTEQGAPVVVAHEPIPPPASGADPISIPPSGSTPVPVARTARTRPPVAATVPGPVPSPPPPAATGGFTPATLLRWMPFVLIGCFLLGFGRALPGSGGVIGFALVIGLIYFLVKVAAASSRKTTSMPRDTTWNRPRSRRRK